MAKARLPELVPAGLLLDSLDDAFGRLAFTIAAGELAPGIPPEPMRPRRFRRFMFDSSRSYRTRDRAWAAIVTRARRPDPTASAWRLVAVGLCISGLRGFRRRITVASAGELPDVHADLVEGFLIRLGSIEIDKQNIAGRLVDSAIGRAKRRYRQHANRPQPADVDGRRRPARPHPGSADAYLHRVAAELASTGPPLRPEDLELIALTRIDGLDLALAAAELDLPSLEAAYKRRQRAEARIAAHLRRQPDQPAADRPDPDDATIARAKAVGASAATATRLTAARRERRR
jgi:hypothetical protein